MGFGIFVSCRMSISLTLDSRLFLLLSLSFLPPFTSLEVPATTMTLKIIIMSLQSSTQYCPRPCARSFTRTFQQHPRKDPMVFGLLALTASVRFREARAQAHCCRVVLRLELKQSFTFPHPDLPRQAQTSSSKLTIIIY